MTFLKKSHKERCIGSYNKKNYKFDLSIQNFIIENINNNNCLTASVISNLFSIKFEIKISLTTIYSFFKKIIMFIKKQ